jgi:hypothetical protein
MNKINKYNNSIIYEIKCKNQDVKECYIGSTTNYKQRMICHKSNCNNKNSKNYNYFVYQFIRSNGGWENFDFNILETLCCNNKIELLKKERYYINLNEDNLNNRIPSRTIKEYYEDNKNKIIESVKEWNENNKHKIKDYKKDYYKNNKDKIKEKYEKNKDKILEKNKENYKNNKDKIKKHYQEKISEKRKIKMSCECGSIVRKADKVRHEKTNKHQRFINK